jgi:hypothetical protein
VAVLALTFPVVALVLKTSDRSQTDQALLAFAGFAVIAAFVSLLPSRHNEQIRQAQLDSAKDLARIAELLEQQNMSTAAITQPAKRRRPSARIVALILFALVVAHLRR